MTIDPFLLICRHLVSLAHDRQQQQSLAEPRALGRSSAAGGLGFQTRHASGIMDVAAEP
jgi:hypothetical protein